MIKKILIYVGMLVFWLTGGLLDTLCGAIVGLVTLPWHGAVKMRGNAVVTQLGKRSQDGGGGFSLGCFIFSNTPYIFDDSLFLKHEWGHSVPQLLVCGPLHPFICSIPSCIRFWYQEYQRKRGIIPHAYDDFGVEGTATKWGAKGYDRLQSLFLFEK